MKDTPQDWTRSGNRLIRKFEFGSFASAIAFMVEVSLFCEKTDHHPEWKNIYNSVFVELTTHDAGDVTPKDIALANHMNAVYQKAG
jgi:4a-hydroxytetrahydrobiopterin dehydratase